jgi:hypothetical protein
MRTSITKQLVIVCFVSVMLIIVFACNSKADNAYRYFNLYKNSEIYKERHPEENNDQAEPDRGPKFDGWGNLVDDPPPPPPDNEYNDEPGGDDTAQENTGSWK